MRSKPEPEVIRADTAELGDYIVLDDGSRHRITGWFWHAKSGIVLLYNNRYHRHHGSITVVRKSRPVSC